MPRVLVVNTLDASLGFYDATTRKPLKRVKVGKSPHGVAVGRNRKFGFVTNTGDNSVSVVDVIRMAETARVTPEGLETPFAVAALADGRRLITTSKTLPEACLVDTQRSGKAARIELPGQPAASIASLAGGERLWLAIPEKNELVAIDPRTNEIAARLERSGRPVAVAAARDQRNLLVATADPPRLFCLDTASGNVLAQVETMPGPADVKAHPYQNAAFVLTMGGVQPIDLETQTAAPPIPTGGKPSAFDIARAGKILYVASGETNQVAVLEVEKRHTRDTWETGHQPSALVFMA